MRPYLAIIKDSFRAALASNVLYVLLALITLLLVAIAPLHYSEVLDWKIKRDKHVRDPALLVERLVEWKDGDRHPAVKRIWEKMPDSLQQDMIRVAAKADSEDDEPGNADSQADPSGAEEQLEDNAAGGSLGSGPGAPEGNPLEDFPVYKSVIEELNNIIQQRDFYSEEDWTDRSPAPEASELIESGVASLSEERSRRLNRLLIGDALGSVVENGAATSLDFYYLIWPISFLSANISHQQFATTFSSQIPWFFDKFVMSIGLLIAILVTANIIPETFDPGSLNLLLSKPISRWGLLVAKFIGGCAFVSLCTAYLFSGIWVWLGLGMGIWDRGILFSIPVYILVFAIYYSVSTLVGIWYRSAILSVILTGIFWAVCFGVGYSYSLLDNRMQNSEIINMIAVPDGVLQVDPLMKVYSWDEKKNQWDNRLKANMAQEQEIGIGVAMYMGPLGPLPDGLGPIYEAGSRKLVSGIINLADPRTMSQQDCYLSDVDDVDFQARGKFPRNAVALFASQQGPISINGSGEIFQMKSDVLQTSTVEEQKNPDQPEEKANDNGEAQPKKMVEKKPELFDRTSSTHITVKNSKFVDFNQSNQELVIYRRGEITLFKLGDDGYVQKAKLEIDTGITSLTMSCSICYQGGIITLVLGNGQVITVNGTTLKEKSGYVPETRSAIKQLDGSPDGRWVAFVYRNGSLWLLDNENPEQIKKASFRGQGNISSAKFDDQNRIWVADRTDRATLYDLDSTKELKSYVPDSNWLAYTYRYVLGPVYRIFPKPGELYKVVTYLSSTGDTKYNRDVDLALTNESKNPFGPLWSGLGFMVSVLFVACFIFHFKDF